MSVRIYGTWARVGQRVKTFDQSLATITGIERCSFGGNEDYPTRVVLTRCDLRFDDGRKDWEWTLTLKRA